MKAQEVAVVGGLFSNRPLGVKRLQTYPPLQCLMSRTGSRFSSESAPRPFQYGIRGRGATIFRSDLPSSDGSPRGRTNSPHPSSREGHHRWVELGCSPIAFDSKWLSRIVRCYAGDEVAAAMVVGTLVPWPRYSAVFCGTACCAAC